MALGRRSVADLLAGISSRELTEWMAFYRMEPFGAARDNLHAGIVASTVANVNRDTKKRPEPFTPQDFLIETGNDGDDGEGDDAGGQSWEEQLRFVRMMNAAFGGSGG